MELTVYNKEKKEVGSVACPENIFEERPNQARLAQVSIQHRLNLRQGNAHVKNRHEVTGSTRKIYRQKGTGQARHGDIKAPLFVGGGRAFGPKTRSWRSEIPQKIRQGALRDLLVDKRQRERLWIVEKMEMKEPKTKEMSAFFKKFGIDSALLVLDEKNSTVTKSVRNLPRFKATHVDSMNLLDLLKYEHLMMTRGAFEKFVQRIV